MDAVPFPMCRSPLASARAHALLVSAALNCNQSPSLSKTPVQGRLLIGPQIANLPHKAAEPQPKSRPEGRQQPIMAGPTMGRNQGVVVQGR